MAATNPALSFLLEQVREGAGTPGAGNIAGLDEILEEDHALHRRM
jgi:hypothetical protein